MWTIFICYKIDKCDINIQQLISEISNLRNDKDKYETNLELKTPIENEFKNFTSKP